jgi:hypothetical protein
VVESGAILPGNVVQGVERFSVHVPWTLDSGAYRDHKDGKFVACAVEGGAHCLVSSDGGQLQMRRYRDVAIVNPGQFLLALELYPLAPEALAARFGCHVLVSIQASVPLEPRAAVRVGAALMVPSGGEKA